ncbi:signal peptidase I [Sphingomonas bacterium]|uniref:signal peptidase I n=1 Tax=Sphingomonas bacterium TaxID=1895847 RepID=UPI00157740EB|nr:signal peptidase I [Sphingomonas bacterium]
MATTPSAEPPPAERRPARQRSEGGSTLVFLLKLAVIVFVFRSFVAAPFSIPSESMLPRLLIGDYLFIAKPAYGYSRWSLPWGEPPVSGHVSWAVPKRGDVVVFRGPHGDDADIIKRVIGLPGDTVQVRRGQVFLNGVGVPKRRIADFVLPLTPNYDETKCGTRFQSVEAGKPVCRYPQYEETLPGGRRYDVLDLEDDPIKDDTRLYRVPAGHLFVMGDNRDNSADSRFPAPDDLMPGEGQAGMGFVPLDRVEGKAVVGFFSTDGSASWLLPWTWFSAARPRRIGEGF